MVILAELLAFPFPLILEPYSALSWSMIYAHAYWIAALFFPLHFFFFLLNMVKVFLL